MSLWNALKAVAKLLVRPHGDVKSFEQEVEGAGITGRREGGMRTIPAAKIVGSVGRAQNLRSDFFYRTGQAMTARFKRIGQAMEQGKVLPPIEVYRAKLPRRQGDQDRAVTEYYVVDGHHRVAMAKKLGQDFLDAHVVEYTVKDPAGGPAPAAPPTAPAAPVSPSAPAGTGVDATTGPGDHPAASAGSGPERPPDPDPQARRL